MKIKIVSRFNTEINRQETFVLNSETNEIVEGIRRINIEINLDQTRAIIEVINPVISYAGDAEIKKKLLLVEQSQ